MARKQKLDTGHPALAADDDDLRAALDIYFGRAPRGVWREESDRARDAVWDDLVDALIAYCDTYDRHVDANGYWRRGEMLGTQATDRASRELEKVVEAFLASRDAAESDQGAGVA